MLNRLVIASKTATIKKDDVNFQKAKNLPYDPDSLLHGTCPNDSTPYSTDTCSATLTTALQFGNGKNPKCLSADNWIIKHVIHYGTLFS